MSNRTLLEELREYDTALIANTPGYVDPIDVHEFYMGGQIQSLRPAASGLSPTAARDIAGMLSAPFAMYARSTVIHRCAIHWKEVNMPVSVSGITVNPGDVIHAGAEGVIEIPCRALQKLLERLLFMMAWEKDSHAIWRRSDISAVEEERRDGELAKEYGF